MRLVGSAAHGAQDAIAMVGAWDLVTDGHAEALSRMTARAREEGWRSVAILIDPNPSAFLHGLDKWVHFEPVASRMWRLQDFGIDETPLLEFAETDLDAGAADFLDVVAGPLRLRELWLGQQQTLGTGAAGAVPAIMEQTALRGIQVLRLTAFDGTRTQKMARTRLLAGELAAGVLLSGVAPIWPVADPTPVDVAWPEGVYQALATGRNRASVADVMVTVRIGAKSAQLVWPALQDGVVAFYAGPGDSTADRWAARRIAEAQLAVHLAST